jgi:hypothetical protein
MSVSLRSAAPVAKGLLMPVIVHTRGITRRSLREDAGNPEGGDIDCSKVMLDT